MTNKHLVPKPWAFRCLVNQFEEGDVLGGACRRLDPQTLMDGQGASAANCYGSFIFGNGEGGGVARGERACVTEAVVAAGWRRCSLHKRSHNFINAKFHGRVISDHAQGRVSVAAFQPGSITT